MIANYYRLSLSDGDLGKDNKEESNSIENQRLLLQSYLEAQNEIFGEVREYIDDGYTGTNFNRPGFQKMLEDAKKGIIDTILVKDLSRIGRDYIGVGDYLEQIFPVLGVRVIAVNSGYDSNDYIGQALGFDVTISNLINHLYSRDLSKKVKSAYRSKWKRGISTKGRLPYGFIKDKAARGGWRIDPEAGKVVRYIFDKALLGWSTKMIVEWLNKQGYLPPGKYYALKHGKPSKAKVPEHEELWNTGTVYTILRRYEYTGAFVNNCHQTFQPGSKVTVKVPWSERYITEDAHDGIVTKEEFENAQLAIRSCGENAFSVKHKYPLRSKLRCGNCKLALAYQAYDSKLYCPHKYSSGSKSKCYDSYYEYAVVEAIVQYELQKKIEEINRIKKQIESRKEEGIWKNTDTTKRREKQIAKMKSDRVLLYEAFAEGNVEKDRYLAKKEELNVRIEQLELENAQERGRFSTEEYLEETVGSLSTTGEYLAKYKLTKEIADIFIDTVYLYDPKHIEIVFTFEDVIKKAAEYFGNTTGKTKNIESEA